MSTSDEGYRVYTRAHDVILDAAWLATHPGFEPFASANHGPVEAGKSALASEADIAQTIIDAGRDYPDLSDVTVSLLLDQSGSQRGSNAVVAWVDRTVEALFHRGAEVEVLGFTTLRWKGGRSRHDWFEAGKPTRPGRLNDLLHIVYKTPDHPWRLGVGEPSPRECLDRVYREPYLREGIDGEAVQWAASRLKARTRDIKILIVASDCAPVDDSTLSVNPDGMLRAHLKASIAAAEADGIAVVSVDNGAPNSTKEPLYPRTAYSADFRSFDAADAAAAVMRDVAVIAQPAAAPAP